MNLPNKLSVARVLCIPAIVTLLHFPDPACRLAAAALFIIGCLTDFLDGRIITPQLFYFISDVSLLGFCVCIKFKEESA